MKVGKYSIRWKHARQPQEIHGFTAPCYCTECRIFSFETTNYGAVSFSVSGNAVCSPNDNFNKEYGRKLSLKRALEKSSFDKAQRGRVWEVYRSMKPNGRW